MNSPRVTGTAFWGLIAFAVIVVAVSIFMSRENVAKPRHDSHPQVSAPTITGKLFSRAPFFDFGTISMAAGKVSHKFAIQNTGDTPITINNISTSCMCTAASLVTLAGKKGPFGMPGHGAAPTIAERIEPGSGAQVEVVFDPAAHGPAGVGPTERSVTIRTNATPPLELRFTAMVRP